MSFREATGSLEQYTALRYSYDDYEDMNSDRQILLGNGLSKTNDDGTTYTNRKLQPATDYSVYVRVAAEVDGQVSYSVSLHVQYGSEQVSLFPCRD